MAMYSMNGGWPRTRFGFFALAVRALAWLIVRLALVALAMAITARVTSGEGLPRCEGDPAVVQCLEEVLVGGEGGI